MNSGQLSFLEYADCRCVGVTALLVTTVVQTGIMFALDIVPVGEDWLQQEQLLVEEDERKLTAAEKIARVSMAQHKAEKAARVPLEQECEMGTPSQSQANRFALKKE